MLRMPWVQFQITRRDSLVFSHSSLPHRVLNDNNFQTSPPPPHLSPPPPPPSSSGKISPAILFIIVILAVIFFISGLLHLLVRFLTKHRSSSSSSIAQSTRYPETFNADTYQRQLQQLFTLHDSGLDQAFIDALPVFQYKEIVGSKEPFDCAVCLCEFSDKDKLRLLPLCSHAFHIDCIDTWLLSNSTCPLCRGSLYAPELGIENPVFDFYDSREEDGAGGFCIGGGGDSGGGGGGGVNTITTVQKPSLEVEVVGDQKRVFLPVRLGKFRNTNNGRGQQVAEKEVGETSRNNLDARRCFSMGSYQYVVADLELQVSLSSQRDSNGGGRGDDDGVGHLRTVKGSGGQWQNRNYLNDGDSVGKKIGIGSKNESFSVSKIWQWPNKGKFPGPSNLHMGDNSSADTTLPWTNRP